jgi:hypothetical protein
MALLARFLPSLPLLLNRTGATFTTTVSLRGLDELFPRFPKEGETPQPSGAWGTLALALINATLAAPFAAFLQRLHIN